MCILSNICTHEIKITSISNLAMSVFYQGSIKSENKAIRLSNIWNKCGGIEKKSRFETKLTLKINI